MDAFEIRIDCCDLPIESTKPFKLGMLPVAARAIQQNLTRKQRFTPECRQTRWIEVLWM